MARTNDILDKLQHPFVDAFLLLNLGNAGRVVLEVAADYIYSAFVPIGFAGFMKLTGLGLWACYIVRILLKGSDGIGASSTSQSGNVTECFAR